MVTNGCNNRSIEKENTVAVTTKENQSSSNTIEKQFESKEKHTWKSQDNLLEFVCDGEYGVEGWGIYNGYYNYHNRKYKLNIEISEYYNHRIDFYYDANGQGVNFNVSDGESVEKGIAFLFGDIKYIDEKTFSVTVDGSGGNLKTKDDLPFDIPYHYEDVIIFGSSLEPVGKKLQSSRKILINQQIAFIPRSIDNEPLCIWYSVSAGKPCKWAAARHLAYHMHTHCQ